MKLFVFAVDGATFDILLPWIEKGYLPNFAKAYKRGVHGELTSTIPPVSPNAWVSFFTGKNCGKHGVIDFTYRNKDSYMKKPVSSLTYSDKTLWDILTENNIESGYLNMPLTYPVRKIKGCAVSGLLTPQDANDYYYPQNLMGEIEKGIGKKYRLYNKEIYHPNRLQELKNDIFDTLDIRLKTTEYIIKNKSAEFFVSHFFGGDRLQHETWHIMDKDHPRHSLKEEGFSDMILEYYKKLDQGIGNILKILGHDTPYIIMSDHGFGPAYNYYFVNNFLLKNGYLTLKNNPVTKIKKSLYNSKLTPYTLYNLFKKTKLGGKRLSFDVGKRYRLMRKIFLSFDDVDWSKTKLYATGNKAAQIFVNLKGREPEGIVSPGFEYRKLIDDLTEELKEIKNLDFQIYKKQDIFSGDRTKDMPDIVCSINDYEIQSLGSADFISKKNLRPSFDSGDHRLNGIFMASGDIFAKNKKIKGLNILDLAPNILLAMNCPIDNNMDGGIKNEIFDADFFSAQKPEFKNYGKYNPAPIKAYNAREEDLIKKHLNDLGYI